MADTLDPKHLDKRTIARYVRYGHVDEKAYEKHMKGLPDLAERTAPVETKMDEDGDDDESDAADE